MSTASKLLYLQDTKSAIKDAIIAKGVSVPTGTAFRDYAIKIGEITNGGGTGSEIADTWVRPAEWLPLPDNVDGVQKVSILNAVFDTDSEFVALLCAGDYTVDWGDGTSNNYATGVKAEHKYEYSDVDLNSDTVATFGYKQCIITVTPQIGNNLTLINLNTFHSVIGSNASYDMATGFLDLSINSLSCSNLTISTSLDYVKHLMLQQCIIGEISITTAPYMFANCNSLQSVPLFDLSLCTDTSYMFSNCKLLQSVPLFDLRACTNTSYMFNSCNSLKSVPLFNLSLCTNASSILNNCTSLQSVPLFDLSLCTNTSNMFNNCTSLQSIPLFDLSLCTNASSMFNSCRSLKSVPLFNLSLCTNASSMFNSCFLLQSVPLFDLRACTTTSSMFASCISLQSVPLFNLSLCTNASSMFNNCTSLQSVPSLDLSACTNTSTIFSSCYTIKKMLAKTKVSFSLANAKMSATALNDMYTALPTVTGQTVTVTGNYGTATDTPSIATAKGWTVTG